jgi:hypothetical protein
MEGTKAPRSPGPGRPRTSNRIDFEMSPATRKRLEELQNSVRAVGHSRPSTRTLVSALIMNEPRRGEDLETELLVPFRNDHQDAD